MKEKQHASLLPVILQSIGIGFIGLLFPIAYLFLPMLFLTEAVDKGLTKTIGIFALLCGLMGFLSPKLGLSIFSLFLPLILIMHYCLVSKKDLLKTLLLSTVVFMLSILVVAYTSGSLELVNDPNLVDKIIKNQEDLGLWQENMNTFRPQIREAIGRFLLVLPAVCLIISLATSYVTLTLTGRRLLARGKLVVQPPAFYYFRLPKGLFYALAGIMLAFLLFSGEIQDFAPGIVENLTLLAGFLFFVQGLSVLDFFSLRLGLPNFFKLFLTVVFILSPVFQVPLAFLGLVDAGVDLRRIQRNER